MNSDLSAFVEKLQGRFLVFDGPDGAGKSTQRERLAAALVASGVEVVSCRDPGGTQDDVTGEPLFGHAESRAPISVRLSTDREYFVPNYFLLIGNCFFNLSAPGLHLDFSAESERFSRSNQEL